VRSRSLRIAALAAVAALTTAAALAATTPPASAHEDSPHVVASTSWVGGIAQLAGAEEIAVIAPSNLQHPPDYDPKPSDLAQVTDADYVVLAGFEGFASRLQEAAGSDAKVVTIEPSYTPETLEPQVMKLAALWGTEKQARKNLAAYTKRYDRQAARVRARVDGTPQTVVAQAFVTEWVAFAGFEPAGTYGPEPTSPSKVVELKALRPTVVFENSHMGGGTEVAAAADVPIVELVNFPGDDLDLTKVVRTDARLIIDELG